MSALAERKAAARARYLDDVRAALAAWVSMDTNNGPMGDIYNDIKRAATALGYRWPVCGPLWAWAEKKVAEADQVTA